ncbi:MAG: hypothetical protein PVI03_04660 [Candidatus Thorarchaeota archaeon]|jgi:hypothetical protein
MANNQEQMQLPSDEDVNVPSYGGFGEDEQLSPEEAQSKIAMMLAQSKHLETMSETTDAEVKLIGALSTIGKKFEIGLINDYLTHYLSLKISLHRQGRKEIQEVARPSGGHEEKMKSSLKQMLLGGRL